MLLLRTEKAREELKPGVRTLPQKERSLLLLADGRKSLADLRGLFDGEAEQIAQRLLEAGYLALPKVAAPAPEAARAAPHKVVAAPVHTRVPRSETLEPPVSEPPASSLQPDAGDDSRMVPSGADTFEGKRSLATTRMFLFDMGERMFARRAPGRAAHFREALRQARDRDSMLAVARDMLAEIEELAGHERADSLAERIAMLLPPEAVT